jgi:hypothetical protein
VRQQQNIEIAVLLALREEADEGGRTFTPEELAGRFRPPLTVIAAQNSLSHLNGLGLATWQLNDDQRASYLITREGARLVDKHFEHREDDETWLVKTGLGLDLDALMRSGAPELEKEPDLPSEAPSTVVVHNNYSPSQNQTVSQSNAAATDPSGRSAARAGWTNVWVAIVIGVIVIGVTLWVAGVFR